MIKINLNMGIGKIPIPIVKKNDKVKRGQKIAKEIEDALSVPIYSSVNGIVEYVDDKKIIINQTDRNMDFIPINKKGSLWETVREAGIVGMGGAGFPTYIKLKNDLKNKGYLLINASECEPILSHNLLQIEQNPEEFISAISVIKDSVNAKIAFIGMKFIHKKEIKKVTSVLKEKNIKDIRVFPLRNLYPVGEERALIRDVLNKKLDVDKLPDAANAIVINSETCFSIYEAKKYHKPLIDKYITVAGNFNNLEKEEVVCKKYPIGTLFEDIIEEFGGVKEDTSEIVIGGPYTGHTMLNKEAVSKTSGGILASVSVEKENTKTGIIKCACGPSKERLYHIANLMGADVIAYEICKNAVEMKKGAYKCKDPGV
ncbi:MAG: proline reductase-associated electron transfer protein PrdC [Tissierellia bacterium]|nr:proline reductase-associated electron transfer protein PrdC [Tissierellia bacterium]